MKNNKPIVKIHLSEFVEWWLDDSKEKCYELALESLITGSKPIKETIQNSVEFFNMCGYLPFRFVGNIKQLNDFLTFPEIQEQEINGIWEFDVKWI